MLSILFVGCAPALTPDDQLLIGDISNISASAYENLDSGIARAQSRAVHCAAARIAFDQKITVFDAGISCPTIGAE